MHHPPAGLVQLNPGILLYGLGNHLCALGKYTHVQTMHIVGALRLVGNALFFSHVLHPLANQGCSCVM